MKTEKEKRAGVLRSLFLILTLGCCLLIFLNSAADSEVSGKQSGTITEALAPVVIPNYDQLSPGEQKTQKNELGSLVRKAGHCLEFMALGLCSFSFCLTFRKKNDRQGRLFLAFLSALAFSVLYAVSDERHQIFVPGRACEFEDVVTDTMGILCGMLVLAGLVRAKRAKEAAGQGSFTLQ